MSHVGCLSASAGVACAICSEVATKRPSGSGEDQTSDARRIAAFEALENGVVLAVDREDVQAARRRGAHDDLAGHHQDFLAGDGQVFSGFERSERRTESARADDGDQDDIRFRVGDEIDEAVFAEEDLRRVAGRESGAQFVEFQFVDEAKDAGAEAVRLLGEGRDAPVSRKADEFDAFWEVSRHLGRTLADGAGGAENDELSLCHCKRVGRPQVRR